VHLFAACGLWGSWTVPAAAQGAPNTYPCQVLASEHVELASPVTGIVEKLLVDRGSRVKAGQPVAQLRADVERANVALAEARANARSQREGKEKQAAYLDRKFKRNQELARRNLVSENDLDQYRTERDVAQHDATAAAEALAVAQMELMKARAELAIRTIVSPIDGIVTARKLAPGDLVAERPILMIEKVDPLYVETALPVTLLGSIKVGETAKVTFDAPGVRGRPVAVSLVDSVIEATSNTFGVRLVVDNASNEVPAGVKCRVQFDAR
jgi:RND family efflux transporter MFP subunit